VWWIFSGLLILIIWALEFILSFPPWIPILATAVIVIVGLALFVFRYVQAQRAASALENAIAAQGAQQALNARPERRAEIQELQKQVQGGIAALKTSKLGGKKGGAAALYSLPWYMIIGPPGAGKTTAIKHSGLVFPFQGAGGGAVRGVGGTRNCDWWFTNEAILLDTAGRYAVESDDRDEWIAFLSMLKKYRSRRPINGVLVAINIAELIDANEQQLDATGKKLRARIDEVMTQLHMVVPVYVLFTKCDLIAGFNEFFGDMRKSDRAQAWGATLKLAMDKSNPGKIFDDEFEGLRKQIHARALKRLATERNREAREKIYQFPLEFAGVKRNLSDLVAATFAVNSFQGTPILRGFYFTSGTQEGRPLDRVLGRMGQAMGIRPPETAVQQVVESKSFFLHDVFMNIVFPDGTIAARSAGEIRRQRIMRVAIAGAAAALAFILAAPGVNSFLNNRAFIRDTHERVKQAEAIDWDSHDPPGPKLDKLTPLLDRLKEMDTFKKDGLPLGMKWGMYQGDVINGAAVEAYVRLLTTAMVNPVIGKIEAQLKTAKTTEDTYLADRTLLRTYLMLNDIEHLDVDVAPDAPEDDVKNDGTEVGALTVIWAKVIGQFSNTSDIDLKAKLRPHVRYYLKLLKTKRVAPLPVNDKLVKDVQAKLGGVPVGRRYYALFVSSLIDEKYDDGGEDVLANRKYPPITLVDMFADRVDVLKVMKSARYEKEKVWKAVDGPYTEKGHYRVLRNVKEGVGLLEREQWVVPLTSEEKGDRVGVNLARLAQDYDGRYIDQWNDFLRDITVQTPATVKEAIELYGILSRPERPYLRIIRKVEDHTQWKDKNKGALENDEVNTQLKRRINMKASQLTGGLRFDIDLRKIGEKDSGVPRAFKALVDFGVGSNPQLDTYLSGLDDLQHKLQKEEDIRPNLDPRLVQDRLDEALKKANDLLQALGDDRSRTLLTPLLQNPLKIVTSRLPPGGANKVGVPSGGRFPRR
jgi:type VI secretion system protein ImpL